jgi:GTPase SAR1 family protein
LQSWLNEVRENANSDVVLVLVGAKKDLEDQRMISYESAKRFMIENKCALFFETSARTGENIDEVNSLFSYGLFKKNIIEK